MPRRPTTTPAEPRIDCIRCGRPEVACYCAHITPIPTTTRVVVLQHPRERVKAIGTARIAALCLPSAEIVVGVDFSNDKRARTLLDNPDAPAVLLYPSPDARDLNVDPPKGPVTLVVLDGTWHHAKSLLKHNPWLQSLPKVAFQPEKPSEYRIRREPREDYVSTIEALAATLGILEGDVQRFQALMIPFRAMVDVQLRFANSDSVPRARRYRRKHADAVSRLPPLLLKPRLLCLMAEANAWPFDRALGGPPHPHELIHCCATHLGEDDRLDQIIAPRLPLAVSPIKHARLTREELLGGVDLNVMRNAWNDFVHADDVLCVWGTYALGLMRRDELTLPGRIIDVRKVAGDYIKAAPGGAEELIAKLGLPWQPRGRGRGGERLGMLIAITQWLVDAARRPGTDHGTIVTGNDFSPVVSGESASANLPRGD